MARTLEPVDIDGITFDALMGRTATYSANSPSYPVEKGFEVSDAIITLPITLDLTLIISNNPVTFLAQHGQDIGRVQEVLAQLREKFFTREPVTITNTDNSYENMAIISISDEVSKTYGDAVEISISFKEVRTTERQTTEMTARFVGAANVTQGAVAPPARTVTGSSEGSRGSILHGIVTSAGLFGG